MVELDHMAVSLIIAVSVGLTVAIVSVGVKLNRFKRRYTKQSKELHRIADKLLSELHPLYGGIRELRNDYLELLATAEELGNALTALKEQQECHHPLDNQIISGLGTKYVKRCTLCGGILEVYADHDSLTKAEVALDRAKADYFAEAAREAEKKETQGT